MRVATYSQRSAATNASLIAVALLVLTIMQGSTAILTLVYAFQKSLEPVTVLLWFLTYTVAAAGLMFTHGLNWVFWLFRYRLLLVILVFGVIASIGWSVDPNVSATRVTHLVGSSIIATYLGFMVPLATILNVLAWVLGFIIVTSAGSALALPALGIESYEGSRVWRGILTSKNDLGFWAAVGVLLFVSQWSRAATGFGRVVCLGMALLSLATLYFSQSATSLLSMVVGGSVAIYFYIAHRFQLGFVRMVVMAVLFTALVFMAFKNINTAELIGRSGDLTGRGEVWAQVWELIKDRPLTGYGYGSIWNPNAATIWIQEKYTDFTWVVYHAHNGFLQIASEIGLPLSLIALLMVVQQLIEIFYCQYQRQQLGVLFVLGFVITYLVSNYSEARFLVNRELYWILFLALPISMLRQVTVVLPEEEMAKADGPDEGPDDVNNGDADDSHSANPAAQAWSNKRDRIHSKRMRTGAPLLEKKSEAEEPETPKGRIFIDGEGQKQDERRRTAPRKSAHLSHLNADELDEVIAPSSTKNEHKPSESRGHSDAPDTGSFEQEQYSNEMTGSYSDKFDRFDDSDFEIGQEDNSPVDIDLAGKRRRRGDRHE